MDVKGDIKMFGILMLGLLGLMIVTGVTFVVADEFKEALCENVGAATNTWTGSDCNLANGTATTINAITYVNIVESAIVLALGFLGIVVLVLIAKLLFKVTKSFGA